MTTDEGLTKIFEKRAWWKDTDINESTARYYKGNFKKGKMSHETKIMILEKCGYSVAQELLWFENEKNK